VNDKILVRIVIAGNFSCYFQFSALFTPHWLPALFSTGYAVQTEVMIVQTMKMFPGIGFSLFRMDDQNRQTSQVFGYYFIRRPVTSE
jgi:hypothetical protein